ncbi:DUF805 domain-containing protein [Streptomyces sp. NBC_00690]|uniref:DUF805 domain-containing protein n=1 Tax=Streptomyces sp. NBC_00690 TaxID=2975808 RepID=UPI002E2835BF|nr:DUF805 domain-containing protein [Streptomyces sp. NBC_00690]
MNYYLDVVKQYAVFSGRARRKEYWMFFLINFVISIVLSIIEAVAGISPFLSLIYGLAILLPSIGVGIRRLHDTDRSGWWLLIALVPLVGFIILLVFNCLEGQRHDNKYGPDPKAGGY